MPCYSHPVITAGATFSFFLCIVLFFTLGSFLSLPFFPCNLYVLGAMMCLSLPNNAYVRSRFIFRTNATHFNCKITSWQLKLGGYSFALGTSSFWRSVSFKPRYRATWFHSRAPACHRVERNTAWSLQLSISTGVAHAIGYTATRISSE